MSATEFHVGQVIRLSCLIEDTAGTDVDPTALVFKIRTPAGTTTTYTYGTDAQLVKSAVGNYYVDFTTTLNGLHVYRFTGTGTNAGADEEMLVVRDSVFS